ncbi:uncharacterized protein LOC142319389 [Lycorma delicatula]|uniref:uncharacterized protein LOC142319389 n=1 Tax=Lycorma delicatula TaxID=130591 RepID=UPI003F510A37
MKNSDVMKKVAEAGKVLLEDIKSIENLLRGLGKYVDISEEVIVNGTDELPELMDTCRRCIIQLSKTVLAAHNKAEKSESYINEMKIQNDDLTLESTVLIRQIDDLKEKLTIKNCEKTHLLNIISKLSEENSVIQEQVSQSSYRNILLNEQLHKLWKHHTLAEGGLELEELFNKSKGNENNANLWNQIDELVDEKYKLLEKVNQAELRIQKIQGKLDKSEQLLVKTSEDYENYIIKLKTESDEKIAKLKDCHETLKKNIISTQKENISLIEQVETLRKKNCVLLSNQLERDNEIKKLLHEVTLLKESVENISLCLSEEKSKNYEMKQKLEQINNIQEILNGEETDIDEGAMNVNTTKTGQNDMLNYGILKNNWLKQSKKIETLEKSLKESEKKYEEYVKQSNEALNETEQELNMTKNRLTEYESHVSVLDIELKRQVSMMDKNIEAALNEKRELEKKLSVYNYELCNLTETFNLQSKKFLNLNEKFKISYENCNTAEQALAELEMKYESIKQSLVEKENIIQNLEKGNKEIEQMVAVYNKAVSDLEEEQRKVDKLEGKIMSLEAINNDLESKLREKEDLLQSSLNNLMSVKEELAELNAFFQENSKELQKLESLHNSDKVDFEFNLKKCLDEKKAIEKSFAVLSDEKEKLQKEYDMLCDKLVGAVRTLMENKLDRENMETHIKELNETVSELQKEKDNNEDQNHLLKNVIENTKCVVGILQKDKNLMKELNSSELQLKLQKKSSTEFKMSLNKKVKSIQKALVSLEEKFKREKHVYAKNLKIKDIQLEEKEKSLKVANDHIDGLQILLHKTHNHLIIKRQECHKLQVDILRIESEKQTVVSRVQELECQLKNALA